MLGLLKTCIKIIFIGIFLFGISQLEVNNKKLYHHAESFAYKIIEKYGSKLENKLTKSIKRKLSIFLKERISDLLDEKKLPHKTDSKIINHDADMDEDKMQEILGK